MSDKKVVKMVMNEKNTIKNSKSLLEQIKTNKKSFIPPKKKMQESIENDANYLMALAGFIEKAQNEMARKISSQQHYEAAKIQLEIFDAIAKFQANEGIVHDKTLHYEKVFLPMYEKDLEESNKKFSGLLTECENLLGKQTTNDDEQKILNFLKKEIEIYTTSLLKEDEEYQLHTYKILKRLYGKHKEIISMDASQN